MRDLITARDIPRVAISPIVGGEAIKGPAAKLMVELGYVASAEAVAQYYGTLINGFVYDVVDGNLNVPQQYVTKFETIMKTDDIKVSLARNVLEWIQQW